MQVFKAFFKILNRNKLAMVIYIGIYMALTIIMSGSGASSYTSDFSQVSMEIGVDNQDKGELGKALVEYLSKENNIKDIPKEREELLDAMYYREMQYVLVIPEDFTERFLAGEREEVLEGTVVPGNNTAFLAEMEVNEFLKTLGMYVDGGFAPDKAAEQALLDMQEEARVEFLSQENAREKPAAYYYFQYIPYIFLCVMLVSLSAVLMAFNDKDMDARNKCSSMSFFQRNLQMILGSIGIMLLEYAFFMVLTLVMYPDYMKSVAGILSAVNALVYMLVCLSIAFFVGRLVRNDGELNMIANVIGLAFSFLGGAFVPLEIMSEGVKRVSRFVPSYWYIMSNDAIWKVESLADAGDIYKNFLMTGAFAVAVIAAAMVVNRLKARSA